MPSTFTSTSDYLLSACRRLRPRPAALLTALTLLVSPAAVPAAHAQTGADAAPSSGLSPRWKGPLPVRDYDPLNVPFLLPLPADGTVLAPRSSRFEANLDIINNLLLTPPQFTADFEDQRYTFSYSRGLSGGQEIGIRVPIIARNGGIIDDLINSWHNAFGMEGGGRGDLPQGLVRFRVQDGRGGTIVDSSKAATGLGDIVLEYRRSLTPAGPSATPPSPRRLTASARALLKLPTGRTDTLFGSGAADFGLGLAASVQPARRIALHGNASVVFNGSPRKENFDVRSTVVHSMLAAEWMMDRKTSFVAQTDDNPAPYRTGVAYVDRSRRAFTFGFWRQVSRRDLIYLTLSENDFGFAAKQAPDLILSLGLRSGW